MSTLAATHAPGRALAWWLAVRPWSFTISLAPVLAGTSLAVLDGHGARLDLALAALVASLLIHAGTNLQNDVGDFRRGADGAGRIGPPRATTEGWLPAAQVQFAATLCFALAFIPGAYLVVQGGWPIVAIGLASVAAGAVYTAGPRPVAYSGWGEAFVILFFGPVAVGGMYYLHSGTISSTALLAGAAVGSLAAAVLVVNNLRDIDSDRKHRQEHPRRALRRALHAGRIRAAGACPVRACDRPGAAGKDDPACWCRSFCCLGPLRLYLRVRRTPSGAWLNGALASTAKLGLVFAILLSVGSTA